MLIRPRILLGLLLLTILLLPLSLSAQEVELRDTLRAATVTGMRRSVMETGSLRTSREMMKSVASPLGEGDPIRWIQYLPGVSSGADGTSASYVRGGNVGGNLLTLDGIPVYGYSHVLGLTTVIPNEEVETVSFAKGGFGGGQGNFTSSHIAVTTRKPATDRIKKTIVANNFLALTDFLLTHCIRKLVSAFMDELCRNIAVQFIQAAKADALQHGIDIGLRMR